MPVDVVVHIAGPVGDDQIQRCARCGFLLKDFRVDGVNMPHGSPHLGVAGGVIYEVGAPVEVGRRYQAIPLCYDATSLCAIGAGRQFGDLVDELTYRSYRHQRLNWPAVSSDRWRGIFGDQVDAFEARYQCERRPDVWSLDMDPAVGESVH